MYELTAIINNGTQFQLQLDKNTTSTVSAVCVWHILDVSWIQISFNFDLVQDALN